MNTPDWLSGRDSTPAFKIILNGKDITTRLESRLISLTLTDNRGFEADQLDIELDDADGARCQIGAAVGLERRTNDQ